MGQLCHRPLDPFHGLSLATPGAGRAIELNDAFGSFRAGMEADFTVLDADLETPSACRCRNL